MRGLRTIPVLLDVCRDMEELLSRRAAPAVRQPDGDALLGRRRAQQRAHASGCATPSSTPRASSPPTSGCRPRSCATTSRASTTSRSSCASSTTARTSTRRCTAWSRRAACRSGNRVRYEVMRHFGSLRHGVLRALRRVRAVVHQGGAARPDRALRHPARRVPAPLRAPDRRVGGAARADRAATARPRSSRRPSDEYGAHIIRACETGEPFAFNGNVPNRHATAGA